MANALPSDMSHVRVSSSGEIRGRSVVFTSPEEQALAMRCVRGSRQRDVISGRHSWELLDHKSEKSLVERLRQADFSVVWSRGEYGMVAHVRRFAPISEHPLYQSILGGDLAAAHVLCDMLMVEGDPRASFLAGVLTYSAACWSSLGKYFFTSDMPVVEYFGAPMLQAIKSAVCGPE